MTRPPCPNRGGRPSYNPPRQREALKLFCEGGTARASAGLQKDAPAGTGFDFTVDAAAQEEGERVRDASGAFSVLYKGRRGEYLGEYRRSGGEAAYNLGVAGSMVLIDQSLFLSRPTSNSFALVKASGLKKVGIDLNNEKVGVTNGRGETIIPDLVPYAENEISLRAVNLPLNYNMLETNRYIAPPYKGGVIVSFGIEKIQAVVGKLFVVVKGERTPADFAGLELEVGGKTTKSIVGVGREFYLENITPGTYQARLFTEEWECRFELTIPESVDIVVDLGEIDCGEVEPRASTD